MKILFMGTPEFAVPCLEMLVREGYDVVAAVTQPDRPKGRGGKLAPPPVKVCAQREGIRVMQPQKPDEAFEEASALSAGLIVTAAYGCILKKRFLDLPPHGCINVHASLLPKYRGASPIHQALLNGDAATGVTTMLMDEGVDTGDILKQSECPISGDMYFAELRDALAALGAQTLKETIPAYLGGAIAPLPQDGMLASKAPLVRKEAARLDFALGARQLANMVRAYSAWPGAFAMAEGRKIKILKASAGYGSPAAQAAQPGEVVAVTRSALSVMCGDGRALDVTRLQFENGRPMDIGECWHNLDLMRKSLKA
jgi:methionyl-tRNA formyltransferase